MLGIHQIVFIVTDVRHCGLDREKFSSMPTSFIAERTALLVSAVSYIEKLFPSCFDMVFSQNAHANGMKCPRPDIGCDGRVPNFARKAFFDFVCRLVCKGYCENLPRRTGIFDKFGQNICGDILNRQFCRLSAALCAPPRVPP